MGRLAFAVGLIVIAVVVAHVLRQRAPARRPIRTPTRAGTPSHLDRADFARPDAPWLVVAFSSDTCSSCAGTWEKVALVESAEVAVEDVTFPARRDLHERYAIDSVPLVVVADADGAVRATFLGPPAAAELWARLAELRDGGPNAPS
jgi:hypothetical protein